MRKGVILLTLLILVNVAYAAGNLDCEVKAICTGSETDVLGISDLEDAHAELPYESNYANRICCEDLTATNTVLTTSGTVFLRLSDETDAHVEKATLANYPHLANITGDIDSIDCHYNTSACPVTDTCLATISTAITGGDTNLHIADCVTNPYATSVCCQFSPLSIISIDFTTGHTGIDFGTKQVPQGQNSCQVVSDPTHPDNSCTDVVSHPDQYFEIENTGNTAAQVDVYGDLTPQEMMLPPNALAAIDFTGRVTGGGCIGLTAVWTPLPKGMLNAVTWCTTLAVSGTDAMDLRLTIPQGTSTINKLTVTFEAS